MSFSEPQLDRQAVAPECAGEARDERREHRRIREEGVDVEGALVVHNISLGGVCLELPGEFEVGDRLTLRLGDRRSATSQVFRAEVMWARKGRAGVRWVEQTPDQFLWLCQALGFWWGHGSRFSASVAAGVPRD